MGDAQAYAAHALGRCGEAAADAAPELAEGVLSEDERLAGACLHAIAMIGPKARSAIPSVSRVLSEGTGDHLEAIARTLVRLGPDGVTALVEHLKSDDGRVRAAVARALELPPPDAIPILIELLGSERGDVSAQIACAITRWDETPAAAIPSLLRALDEAEGGEVRAGIILGLPRLGPRAAEAVPRLLEIAGDPAAADRSTALRALSQIAPKHPKAVELALKGIDDPDGWVSQESYTLLGRAGPVIVPTMIQWLREGTTEHRRIAARMLAMIDPLAVEALPTLLKAGSDPSLEVRRNSMEALGKIGPVANEAVPTLVRALSDDDSGVRDAASSALERIDAQALAEALPHRFIPEDIAKRHLDSLLGPLAGNPRAELDLLDVVLGDPDPVVRRAAARTLARRAPGDPDAMAMLVRAAGDDDYRVQQEALPGLGHLGEGAEEAAKVVALALHAEDMQTRYAASWALLRIGVGPDVSVPLLAPLLMDATSSASWPEDAIVELGAPAVPHVLPVLRAAEPNVRLAGIRVLGKIGEEAHDAIPSLCDLLHDPDAQVRVAAIGALVAVGSTSPHALDGLVAAVDDPDGTTRSMAIAALCDLGARRPEAVEALSRVISAGNPGGQDLFRLATLRCRVQDPVVAGSVLDASEDSDPRVRQFFIGWLRDIPAEVADVVPRLLLALKDPDASVRLAAARVFSDRCENAAVAALMEALRDTSAQVRGAVAEALGGLGEQSVDAVPALRDVLLKDSDKDVRRSAFLALRAIVAR